MARGGGSSDRRRSPKDSGRRDSARRGAKKKICIFCSEHITWVDYKDVNVLRRFMSDRGKIRARRVTGNCAQHQRDVAVAIKTAREVALLPYTQRTMSESRGPRGGGGGGRGPRRDAPDAATPETEAPDVDAVDVDTEATADIDAVDAVGSDDGGGAAEEELV